MLPLIVLGYFAFHSYLLATYNYQQLSGHMLYIMFLHLYLAYRKQSDSYVVLKEIAQKRIKQGPSQNQQPRTCTICKHVKPSRYYHCRRCDRCVYRMDHHCQWMGNCVGQFNAKSYCHFLVNVFAHNAIVLLYVFVGDFYAIVTNQDRKIYLLILILPVIFILFETQRLLRDFYSMITINQTLVESYKKVRGKKQSIISNLNEFFGTPHFILWCIPLCTFFQNPSKGSDLLQKVVSVEEATPQPQDLTYADQYIYGTEDQDEFFRQEQNKAD